MTSHMTGHRTGLSRGAAAEAPQAAPARKLHISRHALGMDGPTMAVTCEEHGLVYSRLGDAHSSRSAGSARCTCPCDASV